jgi:hypothetical protein
MDIWSQPSSLEIICSVLFALAVVHTFSVRWLKHMGNQFAKGSVGENFFHLMAEVEVSFGLWAGVFIGYYFLSQGDEAAITYMETRQFREPAFVFVVMTVCSTKPILTAAERLIEGAANLLPFSKSTSFYISALAIGPLLGSFITEPAAMTLIALLLLERFYKRGISSSLKYATLGLLFVNVSIGGVLTPYAAPPVLMVADVWNWDLWYMLKNFGWKAVLAIALSVGFIVRSFPLPLWIIALHLLFLFLIVLSSHHMVIFMGIFLFFLGLVTATKEYQNPLKLRESLLVGFFLGGLVILGGMQRWWIEPVLTSLNAPSLFFSSIFLTAIQDNAALTYLGSQVPDLSEMAKQALVAGAIAGGGLTVIANAPNPAGYGILNSSFGSEGISPLRLLRAALMPTLISVACLASLFL